MGHWRIMWQGETTLVFSIADGIRFINEHPGCAAQWVRI